MRLFQTWAVLLLITAVAVAGEQPGSGDYRRWAVLAAPELQRSGVADLIAATLSAGGIELVEREQIAKLAQELTAAQVMGGDAVGQRLKLGRLLKADALVILSTEGTGNAAVTRLVVAECAQGARLHVQEFPAAASAQLPAHCATILAGVRQRFPQGVTQLLAIPNFISRNLTREHDAWQWRYADVLAGALTLQPGLAVVAIDEARAISQELSVGGQALGQRRLPAIVEGEFRMQPRNPDAPPAVTLTVRLKSSAGDQQITSGELPLGDSPQWMATVVAPRVLRLAQGQESMSVEEQAAAMERRADDFARIGAHEYSTKLREAVLLLQPDRTAQHRILFDEWLALASRQFRLPQNELRADNPKIAEGAGRKVDAYLNAIEQLELVIRKVPLDMVDAVSLVRRASPGSVFHHTMTFRVVVPPGQWQYLGCEQTARAEEAYRRLIPAIAPKLLSLPIPPDPKYRGPAHPILNFQAILHSLRHRIDRDYCTKEDLAYLFSILTEVEPDNLVTDISVLPSWGMWGVDWRGEENRAEHEAFFKALAQSSHKIASIHGRATLLRLRHDAAGNDQEALQALLPEFQKFLADFRALPRAIPTQSKREQESLYKDMDKLARSTEAAVGLRQAEVRPVPPKTGRTTGAVQFTPIELKLKRRNGPTGPMLPQTFWRTPQGPKPWHTITRCGPSLDAYWGEGIVLFMRQPGLLEETFIDNFAGFADLAWDGRHIWLATHDAGVVLLNTEGRMVEKLDQKSGLPPADEAILLAPLREGQVLVAGSFGSPRRGWCAIITRSEAGGASKVRVVFEAVGVQPPGNPIGSREPIDVGFVPNWIHVGDGPPESRLLLIGRQGGSPLRVDGQSLAVTLFQLPERVRYGPVLYSGDGIMIIDGSNALIMQSILERPGAMAAQPIPISNPAKVNPTNGWLNSPEKVNNIISGQRPNSRLVNNGDGWLWFANMWWYRIDATTHKAQRLTSTWLPRPFEYAACFMTSHYGMAVRASDGSVHRVSLDESAIPAAGTPMEP